MRRLWLIPVFAIVLACGGGGPFSDDNDESYPRTLNVAIELKNTSGEPVDMWVEPETQGQNPDLAAGDTRSLTRPTTWDSSAQTHTFRFHAFKPGLVRSADVALGVNGHESHAENFHGFTATWNGTTLSVTTK